MGRSKSKPGVCISFQPGKPYERQSTFWANEYQAEDTGGAVQCDWQVNIRTVMGGKQFNSDLIIAYGPPC